MWIYNSSGSVAEPQNCTVILSVQRFSLCSFKNLYLSARKVELKLSITLIKKFCTATLSVDALSDKKLL